MSKKTKVNEVKKVNKVSEADLLKSQLARALADYDNLRKRTDLEKEGFEKLSALKFIVKVLPVLDMFESAQTHLNDSGLAIAIGEFKNILKEDGVSEIEVKVGDKFDENLCEAIESLPGTEENDKTVAEIALKGYKYLEGPVIRHAKVRVFNQI